MNQYFSIPFQVNSVKENKSIGQIIGSALDFQNTIEQFSPRYSPAFGSMEISKCEDCFLLKVSIETEVAQEDVVEYINSFKEYLSFLINSRHHDPWHGTFFVDPLWHKLFFHSSFRIIINESLAITSNWTFGFKENDWEEIPSNPVLKLFYAGCRASQERDKFFNWFLILETLEYSTFYKDSFKTSLFSADEKKQIQDLASTMDSRKKSVLLSVINRTEKARAEKLSEILIALGVRSFSILDRETAITTELFEGILQARNKLFHKGESIYKKMLWPLFFVVKELAIRSIGNVVIYE